MQNLHVLRFFFLNFFYRIYSWAAVLAAAATSVIVPLAAQESRAESGAAVMENHKERWRELCERASIEQDPQRMLDLVKEINELLAAKLARLEEKRKND